MPLDSTIARCPSAPLPRPLAQGSMMPTQTMVALAATNPNSYFYVSRNASFPSGYSAFVRSQLFFATDQPRGTPGYRTAKAALHALMDSYIELFEGPELADHPVLRIVHGGSMINNEETKQVAAGGPRRLRPSPPCPPRLDPLPP